jgi:putative membrane-bound dehydrogenase-like protein
MEVTTIAAAAVVSNARSPSGSIDRTAIVFAFHFTESDMCCRFSLLISSPLLVVFLASGVAAQSFLDTTADAAALPQVPDRFEVTEFAREPLVRQPCSMAFDEQGRLFVGMGPQYRNPTPDTPGDSVVMLLDTNGDGQADTTKVFATGFNAIQGLAWRGRDLWVANAPDLTIVRDLSGNDEADEYLRLYTDLGNLEHGLHGLNWAPDGKLYMSKGNSKGLSEPGRQAPKPFRDLWGVTVPDDVPDFPPPEFFTKENYQRNYHDPADDWGIEGGILRCGDGGHDLEIVSRGLRNPWDIAMDSGFNWLGTDNDQVGGDRVFMPFYGANFGWNHPWSSHWSMELHPPTAPVSGPLFEGSGTGIVFGNSSQFPEDFRNAFFINDWLRKTTFVWKPSWEGALMRPAGGDWIPFVVGGKSLFRPTDLEFGPDGALWILGWGAGYGAEWQEGELTSEGRIFRVTWKDADPAAVPTEQRLAERSVDRLVTDFSGPLPVRRINAQDELVRRGKAVQAELLSLLQSTELDEAAETWTAWTLARIAEEMGGLALLDVGYFFEAAAADKIPATLNLQIQSIRILQRLDQARARFGLPVGGEGSELTSVYRSTLTDSQPRVRMETVQAIHQARLQALLPDLLDALQAESDATIIYAGWQTLRSLTPVADLRALLFDPRPGVRRAALLGLLETHALERQRVERLTSDDPDEAVRQIAQLWIDKTPSRGKYRLDGRPLKRAGKAAGGGAKSQSVSVVANVKSKGSSAYRIVPAGFVSGMAIYADRPYRLRRIPSSIQGYDLIQTANDDDHSSGAAFLSFDAILPVRVLVGVDHRQKRAPRWLRKHWQETDLTVVSDEQVSFRLYERFFPAGMVELGGNTDEGQAGGKGNYIVAVTAASLPTLEQRTTTESVLSELGQGDPERGKVLFHHAGGAGCAKCHSLSEAANGFGPNLGGIASRSSVRHIVESIVAPSAVITEGFNQVKVLTEGGEIFSGVLLEESGLSLSLGMSTGERVDIPKVLIEERSTHAVSAMPDMSDILSAEQVADLAAYLMTLVVADTPLAGRSLGDKKFSAEHLTDRLIIKIDGRPVADFVFEDSEVKRPYFSNIRLSGGQKLTRNHPPLEGVDATDHAAMHPGVWLGFGDLSGHDFWRSKAEIRHLQFRSEPRVVGGQLTFATECQLVTQQGEHLCRMTNEFVLSPRASGWFLMWDATFHADTHTIVFGDQEEMGFGVRVATPMTEKNGGRIVSSGGLQTAQATWGQPSSWCDYSGTVDGRPVGITIMAGKENFRESWWHNRDYGLFVANPFGRQAMHQGKKSSVKVLAGESLKLRFGSLFHEGGDIDLESEFEWFTGLSAAGIAD